jgi:DNA repair protein RadC
MLPEIKLSFSFQASELPSITSSYDAVRILRNHFPEDEISLRERFILMPMNRSNKPLGFYTLSIGGITGTVVDVKLAAAALINCAASGFIIAHNHPSGNLKASSQDITVTNKLKKALELFDIQLLDHIILTEDSYLSFSDECLL